MKVGIFYFTTSGNTEAMANALAEGFESKGAEVTCKALSEVDGSEVDGLDFYALGSPAQGTEEMDESEFLPFYEEHKASFDSKKVFLFGSYGWGGGQYMEDFADVAKDDGLDVVGVFTTLESPDDDVLDELKAKASELI